MPTNKNSTISSKGIKQIGTGDTFHSSSKVRSTLVTEAGTTSNRHDCVPSVVP